MDQTLTAALEYSLDLFDAAAIERIWQQFASLRAISRASHARLVSLKTSPNGRRELEMDQATSGVSVPGNSKDRAESSQPGPKRDG